MAALAQCVVVVESPVDERVPLAFPRQNGYTKRLGVQIDGPLGAATLDTSKEIELCIPSTVVLP